MTNLLRMWQVYAIIVLGVMVFASGGSMMHFHLGVPAYFENGADTMPRLVAMAVYPYDGESCHEAAAWEIRRIAYIIESNGDVSSEHSIGWHGDASLAKKAYYDKMDDRGKRMIGSGHLTNMEVAVDAWLDGADGTGPDTPGCRAW